MTGIKPTPYLDEMDMLHRAKRLARKERYKDVILFLAEYYKHNKTITVPTLMTLLSIADQPNAYQIMNGLVILRFVQKHRKGKDVWYVQANPSLWEVFQKELINNGTQR